jgi:hypothetical protein
LGLDHQIHDFSTGIKPNGLFWTTRIADSSVQFNLRAGRARMNVHDLAVQDDFNLLNSLLRGPNVPATVSFDVRWLSDPDDFTRYRNAAEQFVGTFSPGQATVEWSAEEEGFEFQSDLAHTSTTVYAEIGLERNGVFFS